MAKLIIPEVEGTKWSDEYLWIVPDGFVDAGGVDCGFVNWCRNNFTGDWRFSLVGDRQWHLFLLSADDYALLILKHGETNLVIETILK